MTPIAHKIYDSTTHNLKPPYPTLLYLSLAILLYIAQLNQPSTTFDYFHTPPPYQKLILGCNYLPTLSHKNLNGNFSHLDPQIFLL